MITDRTVIVPTGPFDFNQTLEYLSDFSIAAGEQTIDGGRLTRAIAINGRPVAFEVESVGEIERPRVRCALHSDGRLSPADREAALRRLGAFLSLHDDLRPFYRAAAMDPVFEPLVCSLYGYHQVRFPTPFEAACWAVLAQRNLFSVARRMKVTLVKHFGQRILLNGIDYPTFPEPLVLARVSGDTLLSAIGNAWKVSGLRAVAEAFDEVDEVLMTAGDYDEARRWLLTIDGIGEWSASFILMRGYGRMERLPVKDRKLSEAVARVYGGFPAPREIERLAENYPGSAGYWAHYLRVAAL